MQEIRANHYLQLSRKKSLLVSILSPRCPCYMGKRLALVIAIMLLALTGCFSPPDQVAGELVETINSQDLDRALSLFAMQAMVDTGDSTPISGKGEIQSWLESLFSDKVELDQVEVLEQNENLFLARYKVKMDSANALGVEMLEGTGEITTEQGKITDLSFNLSEESRDELFWAALHKGAPVLSYAVLPNPNPLLASPGDGYDFNTASLTVVITNNSGEQVTVRNIVFHLLEGPNSQDLTGNISGVNSEAPDLWHITKKEGRLILAPELPQDGVLEAGEGLFFTLSQIEINDVPGVSSLEIIEETGETTTGHITIQLAKFPFALYVSDLVADPLVVELGGSTTLSWEGSSGATYTLIYGQTTEDVPSVGSKTIDNLTQTTTFYLIATLIGGEDLTPVIRERTITVTGPSPTVQP